MIGDLALDTNAVIAVFRNDGDARLKIQEAQRIHLPAPVLGELFFGAYHSSRPTEKLRQIANFVVGCAVLAIDAETSRVFGELKHDLAHRGRPIPLNDIWIAACCLQHSLPLLARDAHFKNIPGLAVEAW